MGRGSPVGVGVSGRSWRRRLQPKGLPHLRGIQPDPSGPVWTRPRSERRFGCQTSKGHLGLGRVHTLGCWVNTHVIG